MPSPRLSRAKSVDVLFPGRASKKEYRKTALDIQISRLSALLWRFQIPENFYWENGRSSIVNILRSSTALPTLATSIPVKARLALEDSRRKALARRLSRRGLPERT